MSRFLALLRVPVALVMSLAVSMMSCYGAGAVVGGIRWGSGGFMASILAVLLPFAVGAAVGGYVFYLLMVGERDDLKPRRVRQAATTRRIPSPVGVAAICLVIVFGIVGIWWGGLSWRLRPDASGLANSVATLVATLAIGAALLFALPVALSFAIAAAVARRRSKKEADRPATAA